MRFLLASMIAGLLLVAPRPEDTLTSPPMSGAAERGATVARTRTGEERWRNEWTMEKTTLDNQPVLYFTETGEGVRSPFTEQVRWRIASWWSDGGVLRPIRSETVYMDVMGRKLVTESRTFDWNRKEVRFERTDAKTGKATSQTLRVSPDTLAVDGLAGILRALDFTRKEPFDAHLLTNEPKLYDISLKVQGKEKIATTDGMLDCYKVELIPHLGLLNVFRFLYPASYFWMQVDSPHSWVRYQGLENGPGSPEIVIEMQRVPPR